MVGRWRDADVEVPESLRRGGLADVSYERIRDLLFPLHYGAVRRSGQWCVCQSRAVRTTLPATIMVGSQTASGDRCSEDPIELLFLSCEFVLVRCPCALSAGGGEMTHDGS